MSPLTASNFVIQFKYTLRLGGVEHRPHRPAWRHARGSRDCRRNGRATLAATEGRRQAGGLVAWWPGGLGADGSRPTASGYLYLETAGRSRVRGPHDRGVGRLGRRRPNYLRG